MKLYLSSYKIGDKKEELRNWVKEHDNKIALIANSRDMFPDGERKTNGIQSDVADLASLGFEVYLLDLRNYFGKQEELAKVFERIHSFYVIGGNTFVLRKAMMLSGFDELLKQYANDDNYLYSGYSAGICLLSKDMHAVAIMDEPDVNPYDDNLPPIYEGIGFINEAIIPHFESDHKETESASLAVDYCQNNKLPYITLHDGDVIVKDLLVKEYSKSGIK